MKQRHGKKKICNAKLTSKQLGEIILAVVYRYRVVVR